MNLIKLSRMLLLSLAAIVFAPLCFAAGAVNIDKSGVAVHGYDPVAYFVDGKPTKGSAERSVTVDGATYWFANDKNLEAFKAEPAKYVPQYGGYCAYGVAQGYKPDIDPAAFKVVDGKLYLNLSTGVLSRWSQDIPGNVKDANEKWKELINK